MKVIFIYRGAENLGVEYLSAVLKRNGHEAELVYDPNLFDSHYVKNRFLERLFCFKKLTVEKAIAAEADLFAFSVVSDDYHWACSIAREIKIKRPENPIIFGGIHPTAVPDKVIANRFVDYVCVGEGEEALAQLVGELERGGRTDNIRNIWFRKGDQIYNNELRPLRPDLEALPFPDKELFRREYGGFSRDHYTIITARGCPYNCSYCYNNCLRKQYRGKGEYLRRRSVENVIEELEQAKRKYNPWMISIYDDIFTFDKRWLSEFAGKYEQKIGLPFFCFVHPAHIDEETVALLEKMKCAVAAMGIQSVDSAVRKNILHRYDSDEEIKRSIKILKKSKIFLSLTIIPGLPGQRDSEMEDTLRFLNKYPGDHTHFLWLRYYPKCDIVDIAKDLGVLSGEHVRKIAAGEAAISGYSLNKKMRRFINMLLISHILPARLLEFIIRRKIYKLIPAPAVSFYAFVHHELKALVFFSLRKVWNKTENINKSAMKARIDYYIYYLAGRILGGTAAGRIRRRSARGKVFTRP